MVMQISLASDVGRILKGQSTAFFMLEQHVVERMQRSCICSHIVCFASLHPGFWNPVPVVLEKQSSPKNIQWLARTTQDSDRSRVPASARQREEATSRRRRGRPNIVRSLGIEKKATEPAMSASLPSLPAEFATALPAVFGCPCPARELHLSVCVSCQTSLHIYFRNMFFSLLLFSVHSSFYFGHSAFYHCHVCSSVLWKSYAKALHGCVSSMYGEVCHPCPPLWHWSFLSRRTKFSGCWQCEK